MIYLFYSVSGILIFVLLWRLFFSIRSIKKFPQAILPTIIAMKTYLHSLRLYLQTQDYTMKEVTKSKLALEKVLSDKHSKYPEWIYQSGFNPGVRAGARSFLIKLDHVVELLFALEFILMSRQDVLQESLIEVMKRNEELLALLESYFLTKQLSEPSSNLTNDISQLEEDLRKQVPNSLELLDMSPQYLQLTALVRNLKDTRQILLSLISALPA